MDTADPAPLADISEIELLREIAGEISKRGMDIPAIFFLEMYKPMTGLLNAGLDASAPIVESIFGWSKFNFAQRVFGSRDNVEKLICLIEESAKEVTRQRRIKGNKLSP